MRGPVHETQCIENMGKHFLGVLRLSVSGSIEWNGQIIETQLSGFVLQNQLEIYSGCVSKENNLNIFYSRSK